MLSLISFAFSVHWIKAFSLCLSFTHQQRVFRFFTCLCCKVFEEQKETNLLIAYCWMTTKQVFHCCHFHFLLPLNRKNYCSLSHLMRFRFIMQMWIKTKTKNCSSNIKTLLKIQIQLSIPPRIFFLSQNLPCVRFAQRKSNFFFTFDNSTCQLHFVLIFLSYLYSWFYVCFVLEPRGFLGCWKSELKSTVKQLKLDRFIETDMGLFWVTFSKCSGKTQIWSHLQHAWSQLLKHWIPLIPGSQVDQFSHLSNFRGLQNCVFELKRN